jgi:CubicO group peptidase (beta-lactamase class C family)
MRIALSRALVGIAALSIAASAQKPAARGIPADFDATVARAMATFKVPGLAVAVVKNDSVIFAKGYGVRALGAPEPVTPHSLFAVGSTSKAFTVAVLQLLAQEGKLSLDDPATRYLPSLQLYDPYVTARAHRARPGHAPQRAADGQRRLVRDAVLARGDPAAPALSQAQRLLPFDVAVPERDVPRRGTGDCGGGRAQLGRRSEGAPLHPRSGCARRGRRCASWLPCPTWRSRISSATGRCGAFPIGTSTTSPPPARSTRACTTWRGGSASSWRRESGTAAQLLNEAAFDDARRPYMAMPSSPFSELTAPGAQLVSYGMAWMLYGWNGRTIVEHSGGIDGMTAEVALVPEERLGLVILANLSTVAPQVLQSYLLDSFFGAPKRDWTGEVSTKMAALEKAGADAMAKAERERAKDSRPTLPLSAYAGTYADSLYGDVVVREANGALQLTFLGNREARLEHWQFDTFQARWDDVILDKTMVQFFLDASGKVDRVRIGMFAGETGDFGRRPAK